MTKRLRMNDTGALLSKAALLSSPVGVAAVCIMHDTVGRPVGVLPNVGVRAELRNGSSVCCATTAVVSRQ